MDDESTAVADVEQSTAEIGVDDLEKVGHEVPESEGDTETETDQVEESTGEDEAEGDEDEPEETVDFDIGGKKLSIPKSAMPDEIRDEFQNYVKAVQATSTKKSQEVAEMAKSVEARETALKQLQALQETSLDTYSKGLQLKSEVEQYQAVITNELWQSDPDTARQYSDIVSQKTAELNSLHSKLQQDEQSFSVEQKKETERLIEQGKAALERSIKGFSSKAEDIVDYVHKAYGIDKEQARQTWPLNPAAAKMAYKAMLFDKLQEKTKTTANKSPVKVTPVKAIKGKGSSRSIKDPGKLSPEAYSKWKRDRRNSGTW